MGDFVQDLSESSKAFLQIHYIKHLLNTLDYSFSEDMCHFLFDSVHYIEVFL